MPASLSSEATLREAFHAQCSSIGGSPIYCEYSTESKVDNCYFVEYIFGLKTIKHTCIIYMQIHYRCKKRCINLWQIYIKAF